MAMMERDSANVHDLFVSFDDDQVKLAKAAGLKAVHPGKVRHGCGNCSGRSFALHGRWVHDEKVT